VTKIAAIDSIHRDIISCNKCDRGACSDPNLPDTHVIGSGNPSADIMFISDMPRIDDASAGIILAPSNRYGRKYEKILKSIGLPRSEVYTTSVIACQDTDDSPAEPYEYIRCRPHLDSQIRIVNPKLIVTIGRIATETLLGPTMITSVHGLINHSDKYNVDVFPIYHPAYVGPYGAMSKRVEFSKDVQALRLIVGRIINNES